MKRIAEQLCQLLKTRNEIVLLAVCSPILILGTTIFSNYCHEIPTSSIEFDTAAARPVDRSAEWPHFVNTSVQSSEQKYEEVKVASLWTRKNGHDWPRMLGPFTNGHSVEHKPITDWNDNKLRMVWNVETGEGYGTCTVALGRAFQFDRFGAVERLTCYVAETGDTLWTWEAPVQYKDMLGYNNGPRCSPVIDNDLVYVYGVSGTLAAISVVDGKEVWKRASSQDYNVMQNFFGVGSAPCVYGDLLITMIGGSPPGFSLERRANLEIVKPNGTGIVAFDKRTGEERYRLGNYLASYSAPVIARIDNQDYGIALLREGLLVFDPMKGIELDFYSFRAKRSESVNAAWPVIDQNRIFISETYERGSVLLQFANGKLTPIWVDGGSVKSQAWRAHWATPVLIKGNLYGCSGRNEPDADLRSIRLLDGNVNWVHRNRDRSNPLAIDNYVIVLGEHGLLQLLQADDEEYKLITEVDFGDPSGSAGSASDGTPWLQSPVWAPPTLAHGLLYLRGKSRLICLDLIPE